MAKKKEGREMYQLIDGKKEDAFLHAAMLGDDMAFGYLVQDLPGKGPWTDADFEHAQRLFAERLRNKGRR